MYIYIYIYIYTCIHIFIHTYISGRARPRAGGGSAGPRLPASRRHCTVLNTVAGFCARSRTAAPEFGWREAQESVGGPWSFSAAPASALAVEPPLSPLSRPAPYEFLQRESL